MITTAYQHDDGDGEKSYCATAFIEDGRIAQLDISQIVNGKKKAVGYQSVGLRKKARTLIEELRKHENVQSNKSDT